MFETELNEGLLGVYWTSENKLTNYWIAIRDPDNKDKTIGLMGLQFDESLYKDLVPSATTELPYQLAMVSLYAADGSRIWYYSDEDTGPKDDEL